MNTRGVYGKSIQLDGTLRKIILTELMIPITLLIFGIYQGFLQVLFRAGIIRSVSFGGIEYYQGLSLHGTINAIVFTTFFAVAFGNAVIPYYLELPISSGIALLSMGLMVLGTVLAAYTLFSGTASVLYTFYPPLKADPLFYVGVVLLVVGSWVAFYNWIPAYLRWHRQGHGKKTPLAVVIMLAAFIVWQIATVPAAIEILVLLLPWSLGWSATVNVVMARALFWFFGHPLVYFWILPAYVMYYAMMPALADGKVYSDFAGRFAAMVLVVYSAPVGFHHQFTEPAIGTGWKILHSFFTFLVAVPSLVTAFTIAASLEYGAKQRGGDGYFSWWGKLPYFEVDRYLFGYLFCGLVVFILGGITGIVNASLGINNVVHNTSWQPAHFHLTVAGPSFLAFLGMALFLCSNLLGKDVKFKKINVWVPYIFIAGELIFSSALFVGGFYGAPRRTNMGMTYTNPDSPLYHREWHGSMTMGAFGGTVMAIACFLYFLVFFSTVFSKSTAHPALTFPRSDAYHDEDVPIVQHFRPWVIGAIAALLITYAIPLIEIISNQYPGSLPYLPNSPVPTRDLPARNPHT